MSILTLEPAPWAGAAPLEQGHIPPPLTRARRWRYATSDADTVPVSGRPSVVFEPSGGREVVIILCETGFSRGVLGPTNSTSAIALLLRLRPSTRRRGLLRWGGGDQGLSTRGRVWTGRQTSADRSLADMGYMRDSPRAGRAATRGSTRTHREPNEILRQDIGLTGLQKPERVSQGLGKRTCRLTRSRTRCKGFRTCCAITQWRKARPDGCQMQDGPVRAHGRRSASRTRRFSGAGGNLPGRRGAVSGRSL